MRFVEAADNSLPQLRDLTRRTNARRRRSLEKKLAAGSKRPKPKLATAKIRKKTLVVSAQRPKTGR